MLWPTNRHNFRWCGEICGCGRSQIGVVLFRNPCVSVHLRENVESRSREAPSDIHLFSSLLFLRTSRCNLLKFLTSRTFLTSLIALILSLVSKRRTRRWNGDMPFEVESRGELKLSAAVVIERSIYLSIYLYIHIYLSVFTGSGA